MALTLGALLVTALLTLLSLAWLSNLCLHHELRRHAWALLVLALLIAATPLLARRHAGDLPLGFSMSVLLAVWVLCALAMMTTLSLRRHPVFHPWGRVALVVTAAFLAATTMVLWPI